MLKHAKKAELASLTQKIAAAIFSEISERVSEEYGPMFVFPAISFKVRRYLGRIPDLDDIHMDELYKISKDLRDDVLTILRAYDIDVPHLSPAADKIEKAALAELEHFHTIVKGR